MPLSARGGLISRPYRIRHDNRPNIHTNAVPEAPTAQWALSPSPVAVDEGKQRRDLAMSKRSLSSPVLPFPHPVAALSSSSFSIFNLASSRRFAVFLPASRRRDLPPFPSRAINAPRLQTNRECLRGNVPTYEFHFFRGISPIPSKCKLRASAGQLACLISRTSRPHLLCNRGDDIDAPTCPFTPSRTPSCPYAG